jgi:hypothetical protein
MTYKKPRAAKVVSVDLSGAESLLGGCMTAEFSWKKVTGPWFLPPHPFGSVAGGAGWLVACLLYRPQIPLPCLHHLPKMAFSAPSTILWLGTPRPERFLLSLQVEASDLWTPGQLDALGISKPVCPKGHSHLAPENQSRAESRHR